MLATKQEMGRNAEKTGFIWKVMEWNLNSTLVILDYEKRFMSRGLFQKFLDGLDR
jgi:hypothetical protein